MDSTIFALMLAYSVGGTSPVGLPASIRSLHSYTLCPNFKIGVNASRSFSARWGCTVGLNLEKKAMETDAGVKGYHMKIVRGGEQMEGVFTGNVVPRVDMNLLTVPMQATYKVCDNFSLRLGPYVSYALSRKFEGWAYDGYVRCQDENHPKGDPTGQKVTLGHDEGERGDYDFSGDMRRWHVGVDLGADWRFARHWAVSAGVSWGLNGIFRKGFDTIEQTMYPIYGSVGVAYRLK